MILHLSSEVLRATCRAISSGILDIMTGTKIFPTLTKSPSFPIHECGPLLCWKWYGCRVVYHYELTVNWIAIACVHLWCVGVFRIFLLTIQWPLRNSPHVFQDLPTPYKFAPLRIFPRNSAYLAILTRRLSMEVKLPLELRIPLL